MRRACICDYTTSPKQCTIKHGNINTNCNAVTELCYQCSLNCLKYTKNGNYKDYMVAHNLLLGNIEILWKFQSCHISGLREQWQDWCRCVQCSESVRRLRHALLRIDGKSGLANQVWSQPSNNFFKRCEISNLGNPTHVYFKLYQSGQHMHLLLCRVSFISGTLY